jgi:hypothetical protein
VRPENKPETSLAGLVVALIELPFRLLADLLHLAKAYRNFHRQHQTPRNAELAKASHGAGVLVLLGLSLWLGALRQAARFIEAPSGGPGNLLHWVPALAFLLAAVWGVLWFTTGCRRTLTLFGGQRDARIIARALFKIAAGLALALIMWHPPAAWANVIGAARGGPAASWPITALCAWLLATGVVKLLIASRGSPEEPIELPPPLKPPARDATADEAMEDMQGHGGRKTALDDREF